ncbi:hypothetical protein BS78_09G246300 [Paspalum vaginatum]|nr:hypothetical protein BS78_09G246300 [Paspalum vaginatum]
MPSPPTFSVLSLQFLFFRIENGQVDCLLETSGGGSFPFSAPDQDPPGRLPLGDQLRSLRGSGPSASRRLSPPTTGLSSGHVCALVPCTEARTTAGLNGEDEYGVDFVGAHSGYGQPSFGVVQCRRHGLPRWHCCHWISS